MGSRWDRTPASRGATYDARWATMVERGENPHGEVDFLERLGVGSVLDAGCGTGRVAVELARRGHDVVGVDRDPTMLATARAKAPELTWINQGLESLALKRRFDGVVMAGNVMIFVEPGNESTVVERCADHLAPGGPLVVGFQLRVGGLDLDAYDGMAADAGLVLTARSATWDGRPWHADDDYAVSVHRSSR